MEGTIGTILVAVLTSAIGIASLAAAVEGWLLKNLNGFERLVIFVAGVMMIFPQAYMDIIGIIAASSVLVSKYLSRRAPNLTENKSI